MSESKIKFENDGQIVVSKSVDVSDVLSVTKEFHNRGYHGTKDLKYAGSFPKVVIESYCTRSGIKLSEFMQSQEHQKRLLNDKSLEHFRVWKGRI